MRSYRLYFLAGILVVLVFGLYWYGAVQQLTLVNTSMGRTDQSAYMNYTRILYDTRYTYPGNGNRMPLYPLVQSLFYQPGMEDEHFFERGKYINLVLSLVILVVVFFIFRASFRPLHTLNLFLITAFTVFMFKAGFFQVELLFYFLNFLTFVLMLALLKRPSLALVALTGVFAGLAYLTKASIPPGLIIFLFFLGAKGTTEWYRARQYQSSSELIKARKWLLALPVVALLFLVTVYPQIRNQKRVFGRYFYNVNSTFYIWYDSWEEVKSGTNAHGDREGWPDMPAEELPSAARYLREHTPTQIAGRFSSGIERQLHVTSHSYGYFKYVMIYLLALVVFAIWQWPQTRKILAGPPFRAMFSAALFISYFLMYAWYTSINDGNRFILGHFLPLMFALSLGLYSYELPHKWKVSGRTVDALTIVNLFVLGVLMVDIYLIFTQRISTMYGGW
jgi:hypothetical protein